VPHTTFTLCLHTTPPTPRPNSQAGHLKRCLSCTIDYLTSSQTLFLDSYNGLIREQRARLLIAADRKGTERET